MSLTRLFWPHLDFNTICFNIIIPLAIWAILGVKFLLTFEFVILISFKERHSFWGTFPFQQDQVCEMSFTTIFQLNQDNSFWPEKRQLNDQPRPNLSKKYCIEWEWNKIEALIKHKNLIAHTWNHDVQNNK